MGRGGNDEIEGFGGRDFICAGGGNDRVRGGRGNDRIDAGSGNDSFRAGEDPGDDFFRGGPDTDLLNMSAPSSSGEPTGAKGPAHVDLQDGTARVKGAGNDRLSIGSIEDVYGTGYGDTISGDDDDNELNAGLWGGGTLDGRGGDDKLYTGEDGNTEFFGGPGDDRMFIAQEDNTVDGGEGSDWIDFCNTSADITVDLEEGRSIVHDDGQQDGQSVSTFVGIENVNNCWGRDTLLGDDGPNILRGGRRDDSIDGRGGDDRLDGGGDTDSLDGGDGSDTCIRGEETAGCEG